MYQISVSRNFKGSHKIEGLEERHSHRWQVVAVAKYDTLDDYGISIDFRRFGSVLEKITNELNNKDLNQFIGIPSSENIAQFIYDKMKPAVPQLVSIEVTEGNYGSVKYYR